MSDSNVIYVEPNYTYSFNNKNGKTVDLPPSLEDFCMIADLEVVIPSRPINGIPKNGDETYLIRYASSMNGNSKTSFFKGKTLKDTESSFLSTDPYEYGTFSDVDRTSGTTNEMFGINSINIEYQTYAVPIVTIKFTDIRGMSLFAPEDLRNNITLNGIKNCENPDICGSFFKSFFMFPHPKFKLRVKGFYGDPVTYELTCADAKYGFDSSTGNFTATVTFVGYAFSVLNDLTLTSLLSSSESEFYGKKYWENADYRFKDGTKIPRFSELLERIKNSTKALITHDSDKNELTFLQQKINTYQSIIDQNELYFNAIINFLKDRQDYIVNNNQYQIVANFTNSHLESVNYLETEYNILKEKVEGIVITLPSPFGLVTKNPLKNRDKNWKKFDISGYNGNDVNSIYAYSYDGKEFHLKMIEMLNNAKQELAKKQTIINQQSQEEIEKYLGFKPSVKNITQIVLAHIDTFLSEIYECASRVNTSKLIERKEGGSSGPYAFPEVSKKVVDGKLSKIEKSWIGSIDSNAPESKLVNSLINATNTVTSKLNEAISEIKYQENISVNKENVKIPLLISDLLGNSNPFNDVNLDSPYDFCGKLGVRAFAVESALGHRDNSESYFYSFGQADAKNFLYSNNNLTDKFKTRIKPNGTYNVKNICDLLISGKNNNFVTNNSFAPWDIYELGSSSMSDKFRYSKYGYVIPLSDFQWDELIEACLLKTINTEDNVLTYGYDGFNENVMTYDKEWKKYGLNPINTFEDSGINSILNFSFDNDYYCSIYSDLHGYGLQHTSVKSYNNINEIVSGVTSGQINIDDLYKKEIYTVKSGGISIFSHLKTAYNTNLFFEKSYYKCTNEDAQAFLFLMTIPWKNNKFIDLISNKDVIYLPKLYLVTLGCYLILKEEHKIDYININYEKTKITSLDNDILELRGEIKSCLKQIYLEWKEESWNSVYKPSFETIFLENSNIESFLSQSNNSNISLTSNYVKENISEETLNNLESLSCYKEKYFDVVYKYNDSTKLLANEIITPILLLSNCGNRIKFDNESVKSFDSVDYKKFTQYIKGFINCLQDEINIDVNNNDEEVTIENHSTNENVKCALYNYLKLIWDKWLSGNPLDNQNRHKWNFKSFQKRWHYIDSFYNNLDDKSTVDVFFLAKDISDAYSVPGYSALSLLSTTYGRNKYNLLCVQNFLSMSNTERMNKMFKAIPFKDVEYDENDEIPDFVIMYVNEPSSQIGKDGIHDCGDSFFISGGDDRPLPIAISSKTLRNDGYKIPAFGVTYGEQYQSYFTNINVNMDNPQVTDVSLQAQFKIAEAATSGENGREAYSVGQNLFTIYSNMSFSCNVDMMGCAWIQPLMYFQLNNIPMFSGTYFIQKVSHNLSQGQMTTSFMGTRLSNKSTPFVENGLIYGGNLQNGGGVSLYLEDSYKEASVDNDCPYKFFKPYSQSDKIVISNDDLTMTLANYSKKYNSQWKINELANKWKNEKIIDLLSWIVYNENDEKNDLITAKLICTVLFNIYVSSNNDLTKTFLNELQFKSLGELNKFVKNFSNKVNYDNIVKEIFTKTPLSLVGTKCNISKSVLIHKNKIKTTEFTKNSVITENIVKSIDLYCGTEKSGSSIGDYRIQSGNKLFFASGSAPVYSPKEYWTSVQSRTSDDLVDALKQTIKYSSNLHILEPKVMKDYFGNINTIVLNTSSYKDNAQVFDILLNTYYDYIVNLYWVVDNGGHELPKEIIATTSDYIDARYVNKTIAIVTKTNSSYNVLQQYENLNESFMKSLKKKYFVYGEVIKDFKKECRNFTKITSLKDWGDKVMKTFKSTAIVECPNKYDNESTYNFDGWVKNPSNTAKPKNIDFSNFNVEKFAKLLYNKATPSYAGQSDCTKSVRLAMESSDGGGVSLQGSQPDSACVYSKHLPCWGFQKVFNGVSGDNSWKEDGTYVPKDGDIAVVSGKNCNKFEKRLTHGHIHVYCNGQWCSSYRTYNIACYSKDIGRPYEVFRHPNANLA